MSFLTRQIETISSPTATRNLFFALLTDFADAPAKVMPQDEELIAQASARIRAAQRDLRRCRVPAVLPLPPRARLTCEEAWIG